MAERDGPETDRMVSLELAAFCASLPESEIPEHVIDATKVLAFDFAGVALAGSAAESSCAVYKTLARLDRAAGQATIIGRSDRASPQYAALANGAAAHALELDDTHQAASVHPAAVVFPAALAVAEATDANGRDLLAAVVVGYEVLCRLAMALRPESHYSRGFHPTATCGVFAAAAAAGRLLGLSAEQMGHALGIAGSQAAGLLEFLGEGAWTKRFHTGWAAHSGIVAAELARSGFVGPRRVLEGRSGFLHAYSDSPRIDLVLDGLGRTFEVERTSTKPHACCRYNQAPVDGVLKLVREYRIDHDAIERITIGLLRVAFPIVAEPAPRKRRPRSIVDAQFSLPFAVAVAAVRRRAGPAEYEPEMFAATDVVRLMDRVECVPAPELDALFPEQWSASVEMLLTDGRRLATRIDHPKGDPEDPLTWEELTTKFDGLVSTIFPVERREAIRAAARELDRLPVRTFAHLLSNATA